MTCGGAIAVEEESKTAKFQAAYLPRIAYLAPLKFAGGEGRVQ